MRTRKVAIAARRQHFPGQIRSIVGGVVGVWLDMWCIKSPWRVCSRDYCASFGVYSVYMPQEAFNRKLEA